MLEKALEWAARAHAGRIGEDGEPEVLHPLRVMLRLLADDERQVALLHDVIEDCGVTPEALQAAGFTDEVVAAVEVLTGRPDESYDDYIARVAQLPLAARVKRADVAEHVAVVSRMPVSNAVMLRLGNYRRAGVTLNTAN